MSGNRPSVLLPNFNLSIWIGHHYSKVKGWFVSVSFQDICVFCQRGRKNPHGCVIQSPLYWLILWACGILLLILYLFWLLFSKYRQLVKSLRVPFKTGGIRPNEASTLWGMHTRICLRSTICICYCCHIYFVSFIKIYRLLLRPFVFWANICSVIPRHFLSASNQKSCERPSLEENF